MLTLRSRKTMRVLMRSAIESVRCHYFKGDDEEPGGWDVRIGMISGKKYNVICHIVDDTNALMENLTGSKAYDQKLG